MSKQKADIVFMPYNYLLDPVVSRKPYICNYLSRVLCSRYTDRVNTLSHNDFHPASCRMLPYSPEAIILNLNLSPLSHGHTAGVQRNRCIRVLGFSHVGCEI